MHELCQISGAQCTKFYNVCHKLYSRSLVVSLFFFSFHCQLSNAIVSLETMTVANALFIVSVSFNFNLNLSHALQ